MRLSDEQLRHVPVVDWTVNHRPLADVLGASPAELDGDVEAGRQRSWATGEHEAELRLWEDS